MKLAVKAERLKRKYEKNWDELLTQRLNKYASGSMTDEDRVAYRGLLEKADLRRQEALLRSGIKGRFDLPVPDEGAGIGHLVNERKKSKGRQIGVLKDESYEMRESEEHKGAIINKFYGDLYSLEPVNIERREQLISSLDRGLDNDQGDALAKKITLSEICDALDAQKMVRPPGSMDSQPISTGCSGRTSALS